MSGTQRAAAATARRGTGLRTVHENLYGNWYGYVDGRRAEMFFNSSTATMEEAAHRWAHAGPHRLGRVHRHPVDSAGCRTCTTRLRPSTCSCRCTLRAPLRPHPYESARLID